MNAQSVTPTRGSILFAHPSDEAYGADRVFLMSVRAAMADGRRVSVLLPDDTPPGWLTEQLLEIGVPVKRGPLAPARRRYLGIRSLPRFFRNLVLAARFIRREAGAVDATVIYVNTSALLVAAFVGRPGMARLVWHIHELVTRPRHMAWLFRCTPVLSADRVIAISETVRRHVTPAGLGRHKVIRVYNGLDILPYRSVARRSPSHPRVAFVGRLNRWKGYEVFLEAIAQVAGEFPAVRFEFFGAPPVGEEWRAPALVREIERQGLTSSANVMGFHHDIPRLLSSVDVLVVPSLWPEPFGLALLEGMAAGCAVVASSHGAASELLEDGRSGLLVPPGDSTALAGRLRILLRDASLRRRLGAKAQARASHFSEEAFVAGIQSILSTFDRPAATTPTGPECA